MNQLDLIDIYRTFHPQTVHFTFFSSAQGPFSRIHHIVGHKSSLGKFKKKKNPFRDLFWSQCSKIKCQLQEKEIIKNTNIWRLSNTILNNQQNNGRNQKGNQNMHRNKWKWKHNNRRHMGISKKNAKGKVHSFTSLPQETREK